MESRDEADISALLKEVMPQDLVKFGIIPEFIGRVPITVSLDGLDKNALVRILKEPKNALVKQYQKLFEYDGVKLTVRDDACEAIADMALARKTGARGLRSIMENAMMDVMFTIPSDKTIEEVIITKECITGAARPLIVRRGQDALAKHPQELKEAK